MEVLVVNEEIQLLQAPFYLLLEVKVNGHHAIRAWLKIIYLIMVSTI